MRDPLILPFLCVAAGILAARLGGVAPAEAATAAAAFSLLSGLCWIWCSKRFRPIPILFTLAALGALDAGLQTARPPEPSPVVTGTVQTVQGCVVENGVYRDGRLRLKVALRPGSEIYASVAAMRDGPLPPLPLAGTRVSLEGEVRSPR